MKNFVSFFLTIIISLTMTLVAQPPKKRIPVDKSVKLPLIYKGYKNVVTEMPNNNLIKVLVDTTKNKRDTVFVGS